MPPEKRTTPKTTKTANQSETPTASPAADQQMEKTDVAAPKKPAAKKSKTVKTAATDTVLPVENTDSPVALKKKAVKKPKPENDTATQPVVKKGSSKKSPKAASVTPLNASTGIFPLEEELPLQDGKEGKTPAATSLTEGTPLPITTIAPVTDEKATTPLTSKKSNAVKYEDIHFVDSTRPVWNYSLFTEHIISNFQNGTLYNAYEYFGAHPATILGKEGFYFAVWAPNATAISVIGNFNNWKAGSHPLFVRLDKSGIWEGFIPGLGAGTQYKYRIKGFNGAELDKGDPYARFWERRPNTASITHTSGYKWKDDKWLKKRKEHNSLNAPWTVYEVHLTSWMRPDKHNEEAYNTYAQIQERLVPYVKEMGFTHVEFMPVMEHPYDGSWGYQGAGYFAPTSRFGTPDEFKKLVDALHHEGIGVLLDWVPSHFPYDSHGLYMFDGTHTYEYADMRKGYHPDWNSYIFNYKRAEVRCFLISNARFWMEEYHADGLRVDAVTSLIKLDYSRKHGEWEPNEFGGNGNLEAISLVKEMNETIYRDFPDVQMIAEESSDWPGISRPTFTGGLGFGMKWMMGWMNDTLDYFKTHPDQRPHVQDKFTFSMDYYYNENFMLPLSHDEVVHGKSPMLYKMPGDEWQKFANLRLLYTYMFTHPGGKLLFMGNEFGATSEWNHKSELQWDLLQYAPHRKLKDFVKTLLHLIKDEPAIYEKQFERGGFEWIETNRREDCIISFRRKGSKPKEELLIVFNMKPQPRHDILIYACGKKHWKEILNSNDTQFGGSGDTFNPHIETTLVNKETNEYSIKLQLPPLGAIILK